MEKRQRRKSRGKLLIVAFLILLGLIMSIAAAIYITSKESKPSTAGVKTEVNNTETLNGKINILLLGLDDGDPENPGSPKRSDTMMVASIDSETKKINILSIPRDTRVNIPGYSGFDKIAHANAYGGPRLAVKTVEELLYIPINYYVVVDWQAFINVVDILGGVHLNVEQNMVYDDPYENLHIRLSKGYQHLDGKKAGEYVRFRHDELGDIGRIERQQKFMQAMLDEMMQVGTIFKLPALVSTISKYVQTDMNIFTMLKVANTLKDMKSGSIQSATLPGDFATINDLSYWVYNQEQVKKIVDEYFNNKTRVIK